MATNWKKAVITDIIDETPTTKRFFLSLEDETVFDFIPGQFITLDLPIAEKPSKRWRHYSIASNPKGDNTVELVIVLVEGGLGTNFLFKEACLGTSFPVRGPLGKFTLKPNPDNEICFICTGTGIAPFRSMLLDFYENNAEHPPVKLIFGTRNIENILYYEEMKSLERKMKNFDYYPVLSRESSTEWDGRKGYVHPVYEELFKDKRPADFYLCGWKNMIQEARNRLQDMGYSRNNIHVEIYG
ncbi:MAG: oxidoreductase [Chitinophagaceae bacterium]|nr:MAG: oxidoreductase [Chitinophagaceae bacterium]